MRLALSGFRKVTKKQKDVVHRAAQHVAAFFVDNLGSRARLFGVIPTAEPDRPSGSSPLSRIISTDRFLFANLCRLAYSLLFAESATRRHKDWGDKQRR